VVLSLLTLLLADLTSNRTVGLAGAIGIAVALVFGMVVLPAALLAFGRWLFWPFVPRYGQPLPADTGLWAWVGRVVARRPGLVAAGTALVLGALSLGLLGANFGLAVRNAQWWLSRKVRKMAEDGIFGPETRDATISFQKKAGFLEVDGIIGTKTWHHLSYSHGSSPDPANAATSMARTGRAIKELAHKLATGRFVEPNGFKIEYVFGAENNVFRPENVRRTDCSELVQCVISTLTGKVWIDGSWNQYGGCTRTDVGTALRTPGALLFHTKNGRSSGIHHVAVSMGDGRRTIEARSAHTTPEVGVFDGRGRFNLAGTVPGFSYSTT
jgi:hypothetical protein